MRVLYIALRRNDAACTNMPTIARPMNTSVEPVGGSTMALWTKYSAEKRGDNDQCPTKDRQQQNRPDDATDDEDDGRVLRIVHKERSGDPRGELSAR